MNASEILIKEFRNVADANALTLLTDAAHGDQAVLLDGTVYKLLGDGDYSVAANWEQLSGKLSLSGGTMAGSIEMDTNPLSNALLTDCTIPAYNNLTGSEGSSISSVMLTGCGIAQDSFFSADGSPIINLPAGVDAYDAVNVEQLSLLASTAAFGWVVNSGSHFAAEPYSGGIMGGQAGTYTGGFGLQVGYANISNLDAGIQGGANSVQTLGYSSLQMGSENSQSNTHGSAQVGTAHICTGNEHVYQFGYTLDDNGNSNVFMAGTSKVAEVSFAAYFWYDNGVRLKPLDPPPASPDAGTIYYDSALNKLRVYTDSGWETVTSV